MRLCITGGGTGGHTFTALTIAIHALAEGHEVIWIVSKRGLERQVAVDHGFPHRVIPTGKLRRYLSVQNLLDGFSVVAGLAQATRILGRDKPHVVLSTGGYVGVPVVMAARLRGIPVVIHEQTTVMGMANRIAARFAKKILTGFELKGDSKLEVVGTPVRSELLQGNPRLADENLIAKVPNPLVYITGGAQGSVAINEAVWAILPQLLGQARVIHQVGEGHQELAKQTQQTLGAASEAYHPVAFVREELPDILAAANVVVGRSGAGTVNELHRLCIPSVLIPLPGSAGGEQDKNAQWLASKGLAQVLPQHELTQDKLLDAISSRLQTRSPFDSESVQQANQACLRRILEVLTEVARR